MVRTTDRRPTKPYVDFPLTPHRNGQFCKKIRGTIHYFGANPDDALTEYLRVKDYLQAGEPRPPLDEPDAVTVDEVINRYLVWSRKRRDKRVKDGEGGITPVTYQDYLEVGAKIRDYLGETTPVNRLTSQTFTKMRDEVENDYSLARVSKIVTVTRAVFNWASERGFCEPMPFPTSFKRVGKKALRLSKANKESGDFTRDELIALLNVANDQQIAMILLAVNGGLGNNDISELKWKHVDSSFLNFPRPKTGKLRRIPLWPETTEALEALPRTSDRVFVSSRGKPMITMGDKGSRTDRVAIAFRSVMDKAKCYRKGRSFYALRHTFRTRAGASRDIEAVEVIMGHAGDEMAETYVEGHEDERMIAVTDHVRNWLFGDE
ncbi:MAG: tyrosine-type recombinase/integrase [Planctomycetaceae bacterium]|nr:tyrosine-type recombinase/integrase [Planctomycetaceae bacterium]